MRALPTFLFRGATTVALGLGLWLATTSAAHAQKAGRVRRMGEVLITAGYGPAQVKWSTLNEFMTSYGNVNQRELLRAPKFSTGTSASVGLTVAGCAHIGLILNRANAVAELKGGAKRHFGARQEVIPLGAEPRFWIGKRFFLGPTVAFTFGYTRAFTYYEYPDGTESWGRDRKLSGSYGTLGVASAFGFKTGMNFGPALVQIKGEYFHSTAKNAFQLSDHLPGTDADQLPRHYDQFLASGPLSFADKYSLNDDAVRSDMRTLRVVLEVGLRLNRAD